MTPETNTLPYDAPRHPIILQVQTHEVARDFRISISSISCRHYCIRTGPKSRATQEVRDPDSTHSRSTSCRRMEQAWQLRRSGRTNIFVSAEDTPERQTLPLMTANFAAVGFQVANPRKDKSCGLDGTFA
ncbi:hypothetical protein PMIN07_012105 [Paraphaeosphaeria minitans]